MYEHKENCCLPPIQYAVCGCPYAIFQEMVYVKRGELWRVQFVRHRTSFELLMYCYSDILWNGFLVLLWIRAMVRHRMNAYLFVCLHSLLLMVLNVDSQKPHTYTSISNLIILVGRVGANIAWYHYDFSCMEWLMMTMESIFWWFVVHSTHVLPI